MSIIKPIFTIIFAFLTLIFVILFLTLIPNLYKDGTPLSEILIITGILVGMYVLLILLPYLKFRLNIKIKLSENENISNHIKIHGVNIRNIIFQLGIIFFAIVSGGLSQNARDGFESFVMFLVIVSVPIIVVNLNFMYQAFKVRNTGILLFSIIYFIIQMALLCVPLLILYSAK